MQTKVAGTRIIESKKGVLSVISPCGKEDFKEQIS